MRHFPHQGRLLTEQLMRLLLPVADHASLPCQRQPGNALLTHAASEDLPCCTSVPDRDAQSDITFDNCFTLCRAALEQGLAQKGEAGKPVKGGPPVKKKRFLDSESDDEENDTDSSGSE